MNSNTTAINNNNTAANMFLKVYPVGSIYITTDSTNPSETYGGTWEVYGSGRTLVGVDTTQTEFNTVNKEGGEKTHILTIDEIPIHNHTFTTSSTSKSLKGSLYLQALGASPIADSIIASASGIFTRYNTNGSGEYFYGLNIAQTEYRVSVESHYRRLEMDAIHTHSGTTDEMGKGFAHNNLQPYITTYMWKRTA